MGGFVGSMGSTTVQLARDVSLPSHRCTSMAGGRSPAPKKASPRYSEGLPVRYPRWKQATAASAASLPGDAQIVPHCRFTRASTRPSAGRRPPAKRRALMLAKPAHACVGVWGGRVSGCCKLSLGYSHWGLAACTAAEPVPPACHGPSCPPGLTLADHPHKEGFRAVFVAHFVVALPKGAARQGGLTAGALEGAAQVAITTFGGPSH